MIRIERYPREGAQYSVSRGAEFGPPNADITRSVESVVWSDSVDPPWHSVALQMKGDSVMAPPFDIGDHVVIRMAPGLPACAWAIVVHLSTQLRKTETGDAAQGQWTVQAVGWFDYLGRVDMVSYLATVDEGSSPIIGGTVFSTSDQPMLDPGVQVYDDAFRGIFDGFPNLRGTTPLAGEGIADLFQATLGVAFGAGRSLSRFMAIALRIGLPSAFGGTLRESVRVVHDGDTALQYCGAGKLDRQGIPARAAEPIVGQKPNPQSILNGSNRILGYIQGTWGIDPGIGELFPSLEDPGTGDRPDPASLDGANLEEKLSMAAQNLGEDALLEPDYLTTITDAMPTLNPGVAQVLQRNPVLLYRMRPWRVQPLADWIDRLRSVDPRFAVLANLVVPMLRSGEYPTFNAITWNLGRAAIVDGNDLQSMSVAFSDDDAVTVVTATHLGSLTPSAYSPKIGLPVVDSLVELLGARVYTVAWPFARGADAGPVSESATNQQVAILAAQGAQWHIAADRFARGDMVLRFRGDIRQGEPIILSLPRGSFVAYCDSVQHVVEVTDDKKRRSTTVSFSRGTWNESQRSYPPSVIPEGAATWGAA